MLSDFCDNQRTDKDTIHSYLDTYQNLFEKKKTTATHVLEVGIGPHLHSNGGSIMMWANYFINAEVYALDIIPIDNIYNDLFHHSRLRVFAGTNAYDPLFFKNHFLTKSPRFDIVLDDGPHTLESMVAFVVLYSQILKEDGILVIEDVQDITWIDTLKKFTPDNLKPFIQVYDLRKNKGRYDDIVFVINKSSQM